MTDGVIAELSELIALRRYAQSVQYTGLGKSQRIGTHLSKIRGRGMDFSEARNYQPGDEVRHMEWRVTARTGRPHVKIYQEERERPTVLLVDFNPSMIFGTRNAFKSVVAARLAALIAWTVIKQGDRVGGFLFAATEHSEFTPRQRDAAVLPLLASLCHYTEQAMHPQHETKRHLSDALMRIKRVVRPGSILVLISDFYSLDEESEQLLARLRAHNDMLVYHICDPIELSAPKPERYAMSDGRDELLLDTNSSSVRKAFDDYCQQRLEQIQSLCKRLQIQYVHTTALMELPYLVRHTFPRRVHG